MKYRANQSEEEVKEKDFENQMIFNQSNFNYDPLSAGYYLGEYYIIDR